MTIKQFLSLTMAFVLLPVYAGETINIDDDSFGVFYEHPMNSDKGLILYINNSNCMGKYRIANNELIIAEGEINAKGPSKGIYLGSTKLRVDCGVQHGMKITRE